MKKIVRILLAILMVTTLALGFAACKSDCEKGNHDAYIVTEDAATCTTAKVEHWACHKCDWTDDRTVGTALGHDFTNVTWAPSATDANKHERACTRCDYKETANHTTGAATCPDCGKDLGGSVQPCTHPNKTKTETAATCTTALVEHWTCPDCDWTEDKTVGNPLGHNVTTWTLSETEGKHEGTCTREGCNVKLTEDHTPNEDGTECTKCHATLGGNVEPCEHPNKTSTTDEATCTTAEIKHWTCPDCDWTDDETVGEPLGHDYTGRTWTATTDGSQHQMACTREGCNYVKTEDHTPETVKGYAATCTAVGKQDGSKCSVCNHVISEGAEIPAIPHNYEGQAWKTASGKHYQECAYGCGARNEHDAKMGEYKKVDSDAKHVQSCTVEGCTIKSEHARDYGDWITTNATYHYKQCTKCTLRSEQGEHNQAALENKNSTQHTVACSACGKTYPDANHVWGEFSETKAPTCTVEGIKTRTCECGAIDTDSIDTIDHAYQYSNTETDRIVTCANCDYHEEIPHSFVWIDTDRQDHWKQCETCDYILEDTRARHDYTTNPDEFVCKDCGRTPDGITISVYYKGAYTSKDTLADAIAFITDNSAATIYLGESLEGAGIVIPADRNITLRLLGNTYTVTSAANGVNGIVLSKGSTVSILNGIITTAENSGVQTLVANYADLTLTNATLDGTKLDAVSDGHNYTLRSYFGTTSMTSSTIKAATATEYALDVLYGTADDYMDGVSVTVGASSVINGYVRYGSQVASTDWSKVVLRLRSAPNYIIHFSCDVDCDTVNIKKVNTSTGEAAQLAHRKDTDWTHDATNVEHYHECTRCGAHVDVASCNQTQATIPGVPATCTANGWNDGVKCSVCNTILTARTSINALGHDYDESIEGNVSIVKAATCTEDGQKTVQCSRCSDTVTRTINALGHDKYKASETPATCTTALVEHWACHNCNHKEDKTVGNPLGHDLKVDSTDVATCTTAQINHMVCDRCGHTEDQTVGSALGHDWATAWTALEDTQQHAHLCQRNGCNAYDEETVEAHTYTSNHCATCGKDITQDEIIDLMADLDESGAHNDPLVSSSSTFALTGKYDGLGDYASNYRLVDDEGNLIVICYKLDVSDLVVGDKITVTGKIKKYNTTIEFDQGCTYEVVKRGDEEISVTYNNEQVTVSTIAEKYERGKEITFTVTAKDGYKIDSVTLNGKTLELKDGEYKFTVTTENVIVISSSSANALPPHNASGGEETVTITNTAELNIGSASTSYTADNNSGTKEYLGLTFDWNKVIRNNTTNFQMNPKTGGNGAGGYIKITAPGNITSLKIVVNKYDKTMTVNGKGIDSSDITLGDDVKEITISATGSITISSIEITYSTATACTNSKDPAHHGAAPESCTTNGNKEYWQCEDCGKYFVKNEEGKYVETTLADITIAAHHTLTKVEASAPTCTEAGNVEHWICSVEGCGAKFTDENGTTPIDNVTIPANGHSYGDWTNVAGTTTHKHTCSVCGTEETGNCASETWKHDGTNHWKICDLCNVKFGETAHTGDTCVCGAVTLTYKVYDEIFYGEDEKLELTLAEGDLAVAMQTYAVAGDTITVTVTSTKYDAVAVVSGTDDFDKSSGVFSGTVAESGIVEIYVSELSTAKYKGATVSGEKKVGDIYVTATVGGTELDDSNNALNANDVITIVVGYISDDYVVTVTVTQGSSVINQVVTLGEYDEEKMTATGTYTCLGMGDVTITVTARAKYTVTIPTIENVTFIVKKVVDGTNDVVLENGATVLAGDKLSVVANAATNCRIKENSLAVNGANAVEGGYVVTGNVTMTAVAEKKVTVKVDPVVGATVTVTVSGKTITATSATVSEEIYITGAVTLAITVNVTDDSKELDAVTVNESSEGITEASGTYTYAIDANATAGNEYKVAATLKDKPAEPQLVYKLTTSTSGSNNSYAGNCDVTVDGIKWNVEGNSQMNPWRFGGKSLTKVDRNLTSKTAIAANVNKIVVTFGSDSGSNITVHSVTLKVYNSDPTSDSPAPIATESLTYTANSSVTFEKTDNADWSNCYYQITFNVTTKSSNYFVTISTMEFWA